VQPERAYTVQRAAGDRLAEGLDGRSARTARLNHDVLRLVTAVIGGIELRLLTAHDARRAPGAAGGRQFQPDGDPGAQCADPGPAPRRG
jgi:hypothetical protein